REGLVELISQGLTPPQIARRLAPDDKKRQKLLRAKLWRMAGRDEKLHKMLAERAQAILIMGLGPAVAALSGRAGRTGRPDAVKLLMEASGFHNPKVNHDHS